MKSSNLEKLASSYGLKANEVTYRMSSISLGKVAKKGHQWLEVIYSNKVVKSMEVPYEITEEQIQTLVKLTKQAIEDKRL